MSKFLDSVKGGGGFTTEGEIVDFQWVDYYPFGDDDTPGDSIYLVLSIQADGADEPTKKAFWLGSGQFIAIEDDGKILKSKDEEGDIQDDRTPNLYSEGEVYALVVKLDELGFPVDTKFLEPAEESHVIDFSGLVGTRVRFADVPSVDADGKVIMGKPKKSGKHKGKSFKVTHPELQKILGLPEDKPAKAAKATKGAKKTAAPVEEDEDTEEDSVDTKQADSFLKKLLKAEKDNTLAREKLAIAVSRFAAKDKSLDQDAVADLRKLLTSDDYLRDAVKRGVIEFDGSTKKPVIALA